MTDKTTIELGLADLEALVAVCFEEFSRLDSLSHTRELTLVERRDRARVLVLMERFGEAITEIAAEMIA